MVNKAQTQRTTSAPTTATIKLQKLKPEALLHPNKPEIQPPTTAPIIPNSIVVSQPPPCLPGRIHLAMAPATRPNTIHEIISQNPFSSLLFYRVTFLFGLCNVAPFNAPERALRCKYSHFSQKGLAVTHLRSSGNLGSEDSRITVNIQFACATD